MAMAQGPAESFIVCPHFLSSMLVVPVFMVLTFQSKSSYVKVSMFQ